MEKNLKKMFSAFNRKQKQRHSSYKQNIIQELEALEKNFGLSDEELERFRNWKSSK